MDRIKKIQISLIILGFFITAIGLYATFLPHNASSLYYNTFTAVLTIGGLSIVRYGYLFPKRKEIKKAREAKILERKQTPRSTGDTVVLWGIVIFLASLGAGTLGVSVKASFLIIASLAFAFIGIIVLLVGKDWRNHEQTMQKNRNQ